MGVPEIPDIFLGWMVDAGSEPTYEEKIRVPPPWGEAELFQIQAEKKTVWIYKISKQNIYRFSMVRANLFK